MDKKYQTYCLFAALFEEIHSKPTEINFLALYSFQFFDGLSNVKDDQHHVWQNLSPSLPLALSSVLSGVVRPGSLHALMFYSLLHGSFCCQLIAQEI